MLKALEKLGQIILIERVYKEMSKTKQKSTAAKNAAVFFIVFTLLLALVCAGLKIVFKNDNVTPSVLGYSVFIQRNDNMNDIPKDSLVFAINGSLDPSKLGNAVLCENVDSRAGVVRLLDIQANENGVDYLVCYDKIPEKTYKISTKDVVGEAKTSFPTLGKVIVFATNWIGMGIIIAVPLLILLVVELICGIVAVSKSKAYTASEPPVKPSDVDYDDVVHNNQFLSGKESFNESKYSYSQTSDTTQVKSEDIISLEKTQPIPVQDIAQKAEQQKIEPVQPAKTEQPEKLEVLEKTVEQPKTEPPKIEEDNSLKLNLDDYKLSSLDEPKTNSRITIDELKKAKTSNSSISDLVKLAEEQEARLKRSINKK